MDMAAVGWDRLPNGDFRVYRDFTSPAAATAAASALEAISEPAFQPVEPEPEPVTFEADPKLQALLERGDEDAPLEGLTAGKAVEPAPLPPGDFHVCAQSGAVVAVE